MSPYAPLKNCPVPSCPEHTHGGPCPRHAAQREHDRGLTGSGATFAERRWYRTPRWFALRARVLAEEPRCPDCRAEHIETPTVDVHHRVKPHGDASLFWARGNLRALCHPHHAARTRRGE